MKAKIYKPSKTAMQSGRSKYNKWVLKFLDQKNQLKDFKDSDIAKDIESAFPDAKLIDVKRKE